MRITFPRIARIHKQNRLVHFQFENNEVVLCAVNGHVEW